MMDRPRTAVWLVTASLFGCGAAESPDPFVVRDSAGVAIADNALVPAPACTVPATPRVSIGTADGDPAYQLYRVFGAVRLSDGRIALVNQGSQELRYYDADGTHLKSAGREGDGPGEFRNAFYLWAVSGDTIWVGDYRPFQFLVFSPEGEWVRTVRPRPEYGNSPGVMAVLDDGHSVLGEREFNPAAPPGFHLRHQAVLVHGVDGELTDSVGVYPNGRWGRVGDDRNGPFLYPTFEAFTQVEARGRSIVIGHGSEPQLTLYRVDAEPVLERIIRWDAGDRTVGSGDVAAEYDNLRARYPDLDPAAAARLVAPLVSDERPVADAFPAFNGVAIGTDGRVWIREYPRPQNAGPTRWTAFDAEGRLECRVSLDVDQVLEFGADYALVLDRDELGVERVLMFDLGRAGPLAP